LKRHSTWRFRTKTPRRSRPSRRDRLHRKECERRQVALGSQSRYHRPGAGVRCGQHRPEVGGSFGRRQRHGSHSGLRHAGFPSPCRRGQELRPARLVDKKEARKMGRFIHFAFAAVQEAVAQSGLVITPENGDRVGVLSAPASAALRSSNASTPTCLQAAAQDLALLHSRGHREHGGRQISIRYGAKGPISATPRPAPPAPTPSATRCA